MESATKRVRVYLLDDHAIVRRGLRSSRRRNMALGSGSQASPRQCAHWPCTVGQHASGRRPAAPTRRIVRLFSVFGSRLRPRRWPTPAMPDQIRRLPTWVAMSACTSSTPPTGQGDRADQPKPAHRQRGRMLGCVCWRASPATDPLLARNRSSRLGCCRAVDLPRRSACRRTGSLRRPRPVLTNSSPRQPSVESNQPLKAPRRHHHASPTMGAASRTSSSTTSPPPRP